MDGYLKRMGPAASLRSYASFADATAAEDPFASSGGAFLHGEAGRFRGVSQASRATAGPLRLSRRSASVTFSIVAAVMARHRLDALVFPQMREELPALHGPRFAAGNGRLRDKHRGLARGHCAGGDLRIGLAVRAPLRGTGMERGPCSFRSPFSYEQTTLHRRGAGAVRKRRRMLQYAILRRSRLDQVRHGRGIEKSRCHLLQVILNRREALLGGFAASSALMLGLGGANAASPPTSAVNATGLAVTDASVAVGILHSITGTMAISETGAVGSRETRDLADQCRRRRARPTD